MPVFLQPALGVRIGSQLHWPQLRYHIRVVRLQDLLLQPTRAIATWHRANGVFLEPAQGVVSMAAMSTADAEAHKLRHLVFKLG